MVTTALQFLDRATRKPRPEVWGETEVTVSNRGTARHGVVIEAASTPTFEADGITANGHVLAFNQGRVAFDIESSSGRGFRRWSFRPGSMVLFPAGRPFSQRNLGVSNWGALELAPGIVESILGREIELEPVHGAFDTQLSQLANALLHEVATGSRSGELYTEALIVAAVARLASYATRVPTPMSRGLDRVRRARVTRHIRARLATRLTVAELAGVVGLSPAHFARAFKLATGQTPLAYVMGQRVERARDLLAQGESIVSAAAGAGFSDQPHLSRLFKLRFGLTPGAFLRRLH
jgi:AraC family transcriptional regulator